ncbi:MAG: hypothetical protein AB1730_15985 [Myxococcota bacterium]|jgi:hypothetical protein
MRAWAFLFVVIASTAGAQELSPPPLIEPPPEVTAPPPVEAPPPPAEAPPPEQPAPVQPVPAPPPDAPTAGYAAPSFFDRCFAVPAVYFMPAPRVSIVGGISVTGAGPAGSQSNEFHGAKPANSGGSGGGGIGTGGGDGKAALIIAAVALIALPVVVYAFDGDADPLVVQRFHCPAFSFEGYGGASFVPGQQTWAPLFSGRFQAGYGYFATDFQFDITSAVGGFSTHALLRILPKKHIEGALALGYRTMFFNGGHRDGFELGLPHRYVFSRNGLNSFGLELRPMFLFGPRGVDAAIEATLVAPLFELLNARVGGRVFSYGNELVWTVQGGLNFVW